MMEVSIYLPTEIYWQSGDIVKIIAEGLEGYYTLLPRHIDYVSVLVPGILTMEDQKGTELLFAVDYGTLIKQDEKVMVSTRNCVQGDNMATLAKIVEDQFEQLDDLEKKARTALAGLEHSMLQRFAELKKR